MQEATYNLANFFADGTIERRFQARAAGHVVGSRIAAFVFKCEIRGADLHLKVGWGHAVLDLRALRGTALIARAYVQHTEVAIAFRVPTSRQRIGVESNLTDAIGGVELPDVETHERTRQRSRALPLHGGHAQ